MDVNDIELDADDGLNKMCAQVFSTMKGMFVFICAACDKKYSCYENFLLHYSQEHIFLDDCKPDVDSLSKALEKSACPYEPSQTLCGVTAEHPSRKSGTNDPLALRLNAKNTAFGVCKEESQSSDKESPCETLQTKVSLRRSTRHTAKSDIAETTTIGMDGIPEIPIEYPSNVSSFDEIALKMENAAQSPPKISAAAELVTKPPKMKKIKKMQVDKQALNRKMARRKLVKTVEDGQQIRCLKCPAVFTTVESIQEHIRQDHQKRKWQHQNNVGLSNELELPDELLAQQDSDNDSQSDESSQDINIPKSKDDVESSGVEIRCLKCPAIFQKVEEFREHLKDHENYICPRCSASFTSNLLLHLHTQCSFECEAEERPHVCYLCDFAFTKGFRLNQHLHLHFHDRQEYQCQKCGKKFKGAENYKIHKRTHMKDKPFKCHICGHAMSNSSNMRKHVIRHFEQNKTIDCKECSCKFFSTVELNRHVKVVHFTDQPHLCSECGATFKIIQQLTHHMKNHHGPGEDAVQCEVCSKVFYRKKNLIRHMETHEEVRKHACSVCSATFKTRKTLSNHRKLHANQRQHKCELCGKTFNQRPAYAFHMRSVHLNVA